MSERPGAGDPTGPTDEDAAFAAIIAAYNTPGYDPHPPTWPEAEKEPDVDDDAGSPVDFQPYALPRDSRPLTTAPTGPRDYEPEPESEHWVPPPPAPRKPMHPTTMWGLVSVAVGLVLLVAPWLLTLEQTDGISFLGVAGILTGIGLLVSRLRPGNEPDSFDGDDGAVV